MSTHLPAIVRALDLLGVLVFALSGGLLGVRRGLDLFGILVLAGVTGLGGGVVRDLLLDTTPTGVYDWVPITTTAVGGLVTFAAAHSVARLARPIKVLDALGLALFCVAGSLKAVDLGATPIACVVVGVITAVGGGIIRDLLAGVVPDVLRRELYAVPAMLGSSVVAAAARYDVLGPVTIGLALATAFGLRILGIVRHWEVPHARTVNPQHPSARRRQS